MSGDTVFIKQLRPASTTVEASYTRPADTTAYAAGDVLCNSTSAPVVLTFSNMARFNGGGGIIQAMTFVDSANQSSLYLEAELWLFDTAPTMQNDNAAFAASDSEVTKVVGIIPIPAGNARAGGANAVNDVQNLSLPYNCAASATALYGVIVVRNAYVPISAEVFNIRLHVIPD